MPLIFAENEETESGIEYADQTGVQYQYPKRLYKNTIQSGERFIYYRGRKTKEKARAQQVYFGCGIVGAIREDSKDFNRLVCDILDYQPFFTNVPFKLGVSDYFEIGGKRRGYFQRGVRKISEGEFQRILKFASNNPSIPEHVTVLTASESRSGYAKPEVAQAVDRYAMRAAEEYLSEIYGDANVKVMAKNNPGFDILVSNDKDNLYVEVKGTQKATPIFLMSTGELNFSRKMASQYLLLIFHQINLAANTHKIHVHQGAITSEAFALDPIQWGIRTKT